MNGSVVNEVPTVPSSDRRSGGPAPLETFYPESRFGGFADVDGSVAFYARVNALLPVRGLVVDVGCGRGEYADDPVSFRRRLRVLRGKGPRVLGIDIDEAGAANPFVDEFRRITDAQWPVEDVAADLLLADYVIEHVSDVPGFFAECCRVLRPGGILCARTTNRRSYVGLAARLVPGRWHAGVLGRVQQSRRPEDVFPTVYLCNTAGKLRATLRRHGFDPCVYGHRAEPAYLAFSRAAFALGVLHQRLAPAALQPTLFAFARRLP